jgi:hypothetical protein
MLASHALHLLAWLAVRTRAPLEAKRVVDLAGRALPPIPDADAARAVGRRLRGGTCLSRALTIAARLPGAEVVIAVRPGEKREVDAHAWVELERVPLNASEVVGEEIARLAPSRRRRAG